ncbi:MAG: endonuclease/exonuclease/phosphatase family protein [Anaerolineae bacterium]|nr:endonuclease/exonuclease/phosphatase family protein [Anaerolineae bacterium]
MLRVLTYNIHGWRNASGAVDVAALARIIQASGADVVALNEVFHPLDTPDGSKAALDELSVLLAMPYAFGVALMPQFAFAPLASYGNALLSRLPILAHAGHHLTPVAGHEQRGLLEARLLLPDGKATLSVYVTHLDHKSEAARLQQLAAVFQWTTRDRSRPHLLLGDFNALTAADFQDDQAALERVLADDKLRNLAADGMDVVARLQRRGYVDAAASQPAADGPQPTYPAHDPLTRIDYIWASTPLAPCIRTCGVWQTDETATTSDHLPVLAEIDL